MARRTFYKSDDFKIIEFTPAGRTLSFDFKRIENFGEKIHAKYYLGLPYVQCAQYISPDHGPIFFASFTKKPMQTLDDAVGIPLLPNVHGDLSVYMPDMVHPDIEVGIDAFFSTYFTDRDPFNWPGIPGVKQLFGNYQTWQEKTQVNPKFILDCPLLRPINPIVDGIQVARSMRYSDIPKMKNFLVHTANKQGEEIADDADPVEELLAELEANDEQPAQEEPVNAWPNGVMPVKKLPGKLQFPFAGQ